jgi:hypothetical protein
MFVEPPFDTKQGFAKADVDVALRRRCELTSIVYAASQFVYSDRQFIFKLDAITESIVEIEVRDGVVALVGIAVSDPAEIDLPLFIPRCFRVVGPEWGTALPYRGSDSKHRQNERKEFGYLHVDGPEENSLRLGGFPRNIDVL